MTAAVSGEIVFAQNLSTVTSLKLIYQRLKGDLSFHPKQKTARTGTDTFCSHVLWFFHAGFILVWKNVLVNYHTAKPLGPFDIKTNEQLQNFVFEVLK